MIAVVGGTGDTGRRVVSRLVDRGLRVRVSSRDPDRARAVLGEGIEAVAADLRDPDSLIGLADGCDAVLCTVGSRTYYGANGGAAVDAEGTRNLVAALAGSAVHLVFLSAFGVERSSLGLSAFSALLGGYFAHKSAAEDAVRGSGLPYAIVRPVELRNRPAEGVRLNQTAPMSLVDAVRGVSREDVAEVLVQCAIARVESVTFEVFGRGERGVAEQLSELVGDRDRRPPEKTPWARWARRGAE